MAHDTQKQYSRETFCHPAQVQQPQPHQQHPEQHPAPSQQHLGHMHLAHYWPCRTAHPSVTTIFAPQVPLYEKKPCRWKAMGTRISSLKKMLEWQKHVISSVCFCLSKACAVNQKMWAWKPEASFQIKFNVACYSCSINWSLEDMTVERGHQVLCSWPDFQVFTWIGYNDAEFKPCLICWFITSNDSMNPTGENPFFPACACGDHHILSLLHWHSSTSQSKAVQIDNSC